MQPCIIIIIIIAALKFVSPMIYNLVCVALCASIDIGGVILALYIIASVYFLDFNFDDFVQD